MALLSLPSLASATSSAPRLNAADTETPPSSVERFTYPDAAKVLAEKGIKLIKGDGHLLLADCNASAPQIKVRSVADQTTGRAPLYCFTASSKSGFLALELPRVTSLETADHPISANLTADGLTKTIDVAADDFKPVGEGDVPSGAKRSTLVELRITG
ncbi:hypothetical protein ACFWBX_06225 [Streptomyces sp. NPDC059991]|uniref:hypothetical protein n=1 Tax=Streptomyces sp. NPDC059991 TaxID=3347028 RepID=UPI0036B50EB6